MIDSWDTGEVLTRAEATERARLVRDVAYRIELDLTGDHTQGFAGRTTVHFTAPPGESTLVDLTAIVVGGAVLNGWPLPTAAGGRIPLPDLQASTNSW
ncbi:MAG: hypothetical protein ACRDRK_03740 [Pseudonocardia sp.]